MSESDPSKPVVALFGAPPRARQNASSLVAKLARQNEESLVSQLERLKEERAAGGAVLILDPDRVRYGTLPNRDSTRLSENDPEMQELVGLIEEYKQQTPIQVKPVTDDPAADYEVVAGRRRVCACRILKKKLGTYTVRALLDTVDPQIEVLHAWMENESRQEMSAFETGRMFDGWLEAKIFTSQDEIAARIKRTKSNISQYIGLYRFPQELLDAFPDVLKISLRWYQELQRLLKSNKPGLIAKAIEIAGQSPRPDAETTYQLLVGTSPAPVASPSSGSRARATSPSDSETVKRGGKTVFEIRKAGGSYTIKLGRIVKKQIDEKQRRDLEQSLKRCVSDWARSMDIEGLEDEK